MMYERRPPVSFVLPLAFLCAGAVSLLTVEKGGIGGLPTANASVSIAATLEDLANASSVIARVTPLERTSAWEDGRIITTTRVRVDEIVAGDAGPGARELRVRTLGGNVGTIGQLVEGEANFGTNEPSFVFLSAVPGLQVGPAFVVAGRAQGQLLVKRDTAGREIVRIGAVGALVARRVHPPLRVGGQPIAELDGALVTALATTAKRTWEAGHAK